MGGTIINWNNARGQPGLSVTARSEATEWKTASLKENDALVPFRSSENRYVVVY